MTMQSVHYDRVLEQDGNNTTPLENKGKAYYYLGRHKDAIACYDKAIAINPGIITVWYEKGYTLRKIHQYEEAIRCFDHALALDPEYTFALNNKGYALNELGKYEEAIFCFDKILELSPKNSRAASVKVLRCGSWVKTKRQSDFLTRPQKSIPSTHLCGTIKRLHFAISAGKRKLMSV